MKLKRKADQKNMNSTELRRKYMTTYRNKNRKKYNEYCNKWYHENREQQNQYKKDWKNKKIQEAKEQGILNAWGYVNLGNPPIYKE